MDEEVKRQLLVSHAQKIRHKMCTWPAACKDPVCALGWFILDFYATYEERATFGNVREPNIGGSHPT